MNDDKTPSSSTQEESINRIKDQDVSRILKDLVRNQSAAIVYINIDERSGDIFFDAGTDIKGDVVGGKQSKYIVSQPGGSDSLAIARYVTDKEKEKITKVYVESPLYGQALQILKERHILILWGQMHTGKWTTAVRLLLSVAATEIIEIRPNVTVEELCALKPDSTVGYVIDSFASDSAQALSSNDLKRLHTRFAESHLIVTVDQQISLRRTDIADHLLIWSPALIPSDQLLQKHLHWYSGSLNIGHEVRELAERSEIRTILKEDLVPHDINHLAKLLVEAAKSKLGPEDVISQFGHRTAHWVEEWFIEHREIEKRTLMISLAVLSGTREDAVFQSDDALQSSIRGKVTQSKPSEQSDVFATSRIQLLRQAGARLITGHRDTESGRISVGLVEFSNRALQPAVLNYVWHEYDRLRRPLVDWLMYLGSQEDSEVRAKAAAAVGELSKHNFIHIKESILLPWANHETKRARAAAAFALGIPAWESESAPQVLGLLHHWSTMDNWRLRWTAAAAFGDLVGLRFPDAALGDLYSIAKAGDLRLLDVLSNSIGYLFYNGRHESSYYHKVLDALVVWTDDVETLRSEDATFAGILIFLKQMLSARIQPQSDGEEWPTLLWLAKQERTYREIVVLLWRRALNHKATRSFALQILQHLLLETALNTHRYISIMEILQMLIQRGTEREKMRLREYLNRWDSNPRQRCESCARLLTDLNLIQ